MKIVKLALWTLCAGGLVAGTTYAQTTKEARPASFDYDAYYAQDESPESPSDQPAPPAGDAGAAGCGAAATGCNAGCSACNGHGCDSCCDDNCGGLCDPCCTVGEPWTLFQPRCCGPTIGGWFAMGYTWNPDSPDDRLNFGQLFTDRSNDFRLNQIVLNIEKALDPENACCAHWGYKLELMYGTDARFIHGLGLLDNVTDDSVQPDVVEAYVSYHSPILSDGGVDFKIGKFVTLHGYEVINATGNPLYSHSYMFNFGIPFTHSGVLATWHAADQLDIMGGIVSGINTAIDDNNDALSFHGGFLWKSCNERATILAALHYGAENPDSFAAFGADPDDDMRTIIDVVTTLKISDRLTSVTDINIGEEEAPLGIGGTDAEWYGVAQYFLYKTSDCVTWVVRGEAFRDDDGFAVFKDPENDGFMNLQRGIVPNSLIFGGADTYYEVTFGLNYRWNANLMIRPEIRYDWAEDTTPYDDFSDDDQTTAAFDVILTF